MWSLQLNEDYYYYYYYICPVVTKCHCCSLQPRNVLCCIYQTSFCARKYVIRKLSCDIVWPIFLCSVLCEHSNQINQIYWTTTGLKISSTHVCSDSESSNAGVSAFGHRTTLDVRLLRSRLLRPLEDDVLTANVLSTCLDARCLSSGAWKVIMCRPLKWCQILSTALDLIPFSKVWYIVIKIWQAV